jgi:hypothetical protein
LEREARTRKGKPKEPAHSGLFFKKFFNFIFLFFFILIQKNGTGKGVLFSGFPALFCSVSLQVSLTKISSFSNQIEYWIFNENFKKKIEIYQNISFQNFFYYFVF